MIEDFISKSDFVENDAGLGYLELDESVPILAIPLFLISQYIYWKRLEPFKHYHPITAIKPGGQAIWRVKIALEDGVKNCDYGALLMWTSEAAAWFKS
jgi:hypothetical protein